MKAILYTWAIGCMLLGGSITAFGQAPDTSGFLPNVVIDEIVITNKQFKVDDFIRMVRNDTTFYKAFKTMRLVTYGAENNIKVYDKKGKNLRASLQSETKQIYRDGCRSMRVLEEQVTGDFYDKKGRYKYYTAELFASLFFTEGKICGENNIVKGSLNGETKGKDGIEKRKAQLKQLMFNPGARISGVPFIGNKAAIFDPEIAQYYDFRIAQESKNGTLCYRFDAIPRAGHEDDVVIKKLITWFRTSDYSIVSRDYVLRYSNMAFDFDVAIHVDLQQIGQHLLPTFISYRGNWHVFTKSRERVNFTASFDY
jgi:hypothetical protein